MLNLFQHLCCSVKLKRYYVYIIGNNKPVLYIGVTSDFIKRVYQHKHKVFDGFSEQYKLNRLLYYEAFEFINDAISREKQLKNWHRKWEINLIKSINPEFKDLYKDIIR